MHIDLPGSILSVVRHGYRTASVIDRFLTLDCRDSMDEYAALETFLCQKAGFDGPERNHSCFILKMERTGGCIYIEFCDGVIFFGEGIVLHPGS